MGYTLGIGQATVEWDRDRVGLWVESVKLDDAPAFGEPTDYTNFRWPSYSSWSDFSATLEIMPIMFGERNGGCSETRIGDQWVSPLLDDHPGAAPITQEHLDYVDQAVAVYRAKHPDHFAQYPPLKPGVEEKGPFNREEDYVDDPRYDPILCRAEWLLFWLRWALKNCDKPVFVNS